MKAGFFFIFSCYIFNTLVCYYTKCKTPTWLRFFSALMPFIFALISSVKTASQKKKEKKRGKGSLCVTDPVVNDIDIRWLSGMTVIGYLIRPGYLRDEPRLSRHSTRTSIGPSLSCSYLSSLSLPPSLRHCV